MLCFYKWGWFRILCQWSNQCRVVNVHKCNNDGLFSELFIAIWSFIFHSYGQVWFIYNCAQSMLLCTISCNGCIIYIFQHRAVQIPRYLLCIKHIHTLYISRNCLSWKEPTESQTLTQPRSSVRKINKTSLNFLTDQPFSGRLWQAANCQSKFLFGCLRCACGCIVACLLFAHWLVLFVGGRARLGWRCIALFTGQICIKQRLNKPCRAGTRPV